MDVLTGELGNGTSILGSTSEETEETNAENEQFEGAVAYGSLTDINGETTQRER